MKFELTNPDGYFEALRVGEFPNAETQGDGSVMHVLQVVDAEDLRELVNRWEAEGKPELLIDRDHLAYEKTHTTESLGWVQDLTLQENRLVPRAKWTADGQRVLEGGIYKFCSVVLLCRDEEGQDPDAGTSRENPRRVRPVRVDSIALTNRPNIPGLRPLSNRAPAPGAAVRNNEKPEPTNQPKNNKMELKALALKLGLPEDAAEADVMLALDAVVEAAKTSKETAEASAEETMEEYKNCIPEASREFYRASLVSNRKVTLEVLKGHKAQLEATKPAPETRVHNREAAPVKGTPNGIKDGPLTEAAKDAQQKAAILAIKNRRPELNHGAAFDIARAEKPELFS